MSDITETLRSLAAGDVTLDQVAEDFAARTWPTPPKPADNLDAAMKRMAEDPEPLTPGTWDEVSAAYTSGLIDDEQYAALFKAVQRH
ncbi:hypothetical protein ACFY05_32135 [Microtetraspora fusca]|uniref:Antitoxin VbhA domain-containing protein n=1 Tax=Microtetraspora fusca TaxID=1997 RepID=A0ABW6VF29_MICFU